MPNVPVNGPYPAVQYEPTETGTPVYHEDREVTLASATGSQMFRTYNAQFNPSAMPPSWEFASGSPPAYATAQNPDGSIHYFTNPAGETTWTTWAGSGNNAVYNAVDYGLAVNGSASANQTALQDAVTAAFTGGGGMVVIPSGTYQISGTVSIDYGGAPGDDHGLIIAGTSGDTELVQNNTSADTFSFTDMNSGRGVRIRDLRITYVTGGVAPPVLPAAVLANNSQNVVCERVYFNNCPTAFSIEGSLQCGLVQCTIQYNSYPAATMVYINGPESFIDRCVILQNQRSQGGPANCIGVVIQQGGADYYISNSHIEHFTTGIHVYEEGANLTHLFISNVVCESWSWPTFVDGF